MIEQDEQVDHDEELTLVPDHMADPTWFRYAVFIGTNTEGGESNKFYEVSIELLDDGRFLLRKRWGARPDFLTSGQTKDQHFINMRQALRDANQIFQSKIDKGYREVERGY